MPHGVLFRGNAEAQIRENLIRKGYIKGIIGLPANLFYGTGIPACIIILDKENAEGRKGIFMIDASKGFIKDGNKNRLREQDIHKIVDVFNKGLEVPKYARMVPVAEIEENKYNLNIPRYIDSQEVEDIQDIEAHISGGIPKADIDALQNYWDVYPSLKEELFEDTDRKNYCQLKVEPKHIRITIFSHPEFIKYATEINAVFLQWQSEHETRLKSIAIGDKPKLLIHDLAESLLATFADKKLIDAYDIYQHLLNYWFAVMQDDVYMLVIEGWQAGNEVEYQKKDWDGKLIPKQLLTEVYFLKEKKEIQELEAARDTITQELISIEAEHNTEDGLLADAQNEKGKVTKATVQKRLKELLKSAKEQPLNMAAEPAAVYGEETEDDELSILNKYLALLEKEAAADKKVKEAQAKLEKLLLAKYRALSNEEIKTLAVTNKWMGWLNKDVQNEMDRISQRLATRVKELTERYEYTLPEVATEVRSLEEKVNEHLQAMGFDISSLSSLADLSLLEN